MPSEDTGVFYRCNVYLRLLPDTNPVGARERCAVKLLRLR